MMKIGAALAADLDILTAALDEPGADVLHTLHQLGVDAQAAVPTYLGLRVNEEARMLLTSGAPAGNMYAAGEIMAGNVLGKGYLAGIGMTIGAVFGRIAGEGAAAHARN